MTGVVIEQLRIYEVWGMTAQEQAFDVAQRYIYGNSREREAILSCFQGEQRDI